MTRQPATFAALVLVLSATGACEAREQPVARDAAEQSQPVTSGAAAQEQPLTRAAAAKGQPVRSDAEVLVDFHTRLNTYVDMRKKADDTVPARKKTDDPRVIHSAQLGLAERIRNARASAKAGDIFTPEIATNLRRLLHPQAGIETRAAIKDDNPGEIPLKVNADYPDTETLSTVPANVLQTLPRLPPDIEYRFIGKHLILRDGRANLIIDYMPNAIS